MCKVYFDKDDVLTARVSMQEPFEMFMSDPWVWISDGCNDGNTEEYHKLDVLAAFLCGTVLKKELPEEFQNLNAKELQKEYSRRFPILMGKALQTIGKQMEEDQIRLAIDYPEIEEL